MSGHFAVGNQPGHPSIVSEHTAQPIKTWSIRILSASELVTVHSQSSVN